MQFQYVPVAGAPPHNRYPKQDIERFPEITFPLEGLGQSPGHLFVPCKDGQDLLMVDLFVRGALGPDAHEQHGWVWKRVAEHLTDTSDPKVMRSHLQEFRSLSCIRENLSS